jgi:hypothetical protein
MSLRLQSACVLVVWLSLFAFDFADDTGLIDDVQEDIDNSVDAALEDFGEALKSSVASQQLIASDQSLHLPALAAAIAHFTNSAPQPLMRLEGYTYRILKPADLYNLLL